MTDNPNVILIFADDLGRGMLSCYGQQHFETPNIDRLANEGMKFNHAYGCAFCAPSRASMLTGLHDCHEGTWTYTQGGLYHRLSAGEMTLDQVTELLHTTGLQAGPDDIFLAQIAEHAGYTTGQNANLLYELNDDYREEHDVSADYPDIVARLSGGMLNACDGDYRNGTPQAHFAAYQDF